MGVTISTHNGSSVSREHNKRNEKVVSKESHIDPNGEHEVWIDEKPQDAYKRLFGQSVADYNARQTRTDRQISNYYADVCKDAKKHPVYEMIVTVGNRDNAIDPRMGKDIMREFVDGWKDRNPNLELIGAYYHADEQGVPHVHCDYIPVAHGYTRGMETQTGLVKALGEQGFEKQGKATAQIQWEHRENQALETLCKARGLTIDHPLEENRQHMHTELYKARRELEGAEVANTNLAPVRAEYEAKKAYVEANAQEFGLIDGIKEHKTIFGKVKAYTVPAEKWETQKLTRMDREAQKRADKVFAQKVEDFTKSSPGQKMARLESRVNDLERANDRLTMENRHLWGRLNKAEQTLNRIPQEVIQQYQPKMNLHRGLDFER